jgi:hypothetical protein
MACERCVLIDSAGLPLDEFIEQASGCAGCPLRDRVEGDGAAAAAVEGLLARLREAARGLRKAGQRVRKLEADLHEMEDAARRAEERVEALRNIQKASSREADELLRQKVALLEQKEQALLAMSTPVIRVWEGVLVLPLIGALDDERARGMALRLLDEVVTARCKSAIIDLTGVPELDAGTARHSCAWRRRRGCSGRACCCAACGRRSRTSWPRSAIFRATSRRRRRCATRSCAAASAARADYDRAASSGRGRARRIRRCRS